MVDTHALDLLSVYEDNLYEDNRRGMKGGGYVFGLRVSIRDKP